MKSPGMRLLLAAICLALLAGCSRAAKPRECEQPHEYQEQTTLPPLKVPSDLDEPDAANELNIPDLPADAAGRTEGNPCLEQPPDFFDTSPT